MIRNLTLTILLILFSTMPVFSFDHQYTSYADFLAAHVSDGLVDYKKIKADANLIDKALNEFTSLTKPQQKIAYLINGYNIFTIKAIVDHYPVKSIKDIRGVWNKLKFTIAGQRLTLDNIEHDILRKEFKEERIHVAVVCASISCPELWHQPFRPDSLHYQLTLRAQAFANDPERNEIRIEEGYFKLSKILDWYGDDFKENYSHDDNFPYLYGKKRAAANFIFEHLEPEVQKKMGTRKIKIGYLGYDWDLNEKPSTD